jgi:flagellar assembly factor FliW
MPAIKINGQDHFYEEDRIIEFTEGLIGLPRLRRAALIEPDGYAPFRWLASIDDESVRFIVVDPNEIYADYDAGAFLPPDGPEGEKVSLLAIVKVSSDWQKTTVNLRAPIFVDHLTKRAAQIILSESDYQLEEALPLN